MALACPCCCPHPIKLIRAPKYLVAPPASKDVGFRTRMGAHGLHVVCRNLPSTAKAVNPSAPLWCLTMYCSSSLLSTPRWVPVVSALSPPTCAFHFFFPVPLLILISLGIFLTSAIRMGKESTSIMSSSSSFPLVPNVVIVCVAPVCSHSTAYLSFILVTVPVPYCPAASWTLVACVRGLVMQRPAKVFFGVSTSS